jgi:hypothetical protein
MPVGFAFLTPAMRCDACQGGISTEKLAAVLCEIGFSSIKESELF